MSIKREIADATEVETLVVTPTGTTYQVEVPDNAVYMNVRSASAFKFLGNASDGDEVTFQADTWFFNIPCYHQPIYLKQADTNGFGELQFFFTK